MLYNLLTYFSFFLVMTRNTASQDTSFSVNIFTEEYYDHTELKLSSFNCKTSLSLYYANNKVNYRVMVCAQLAKEQVGVGEQRNLWCVGQGASYFRKHCELVIKEHILKNSKKNPFKMALKAAA